MFSNQTRESRTGSQPPLQVRIAGEGGKESGGLRLRGDWQRSPWVALAQCFACITFESIRQTFSRDVIGDVIGDCANMRRRRAPHPVQVTAAVPPGQQLSNVLAFRPQRNAPRIVLAFVSGFAFCRAFSPGAEATSALPILLSPAARVGSRMLGLALLLGVSSARWTPTPGVRAGVLRGPFVRQGCDPIPGKLSKRL